MITKPMLAGKCTDITKLKYPVLATPKLDGIRCLIISDRGIKKAVSRNWKPIPNHYVREWLENNCPLGFDGELIVPGGTFQETSSGIMRREGEPEFEYQVFDWIEDVKDTYLNRILNLEYDYRVPCSIIKPVLPRQVSDSNALEQYEQFCLQEGYEGVMVRTPDSPYKCGRSTEREGFLLKIKRFEDHEAIIIGFEEKMHNANEATKDELGRTKRTSHKANQVPMGTLGSLVVRDCATDVVFRIGTGFDDSLRDQIWKLRAAMLNKIIKYKSQPTGVKDAPRFPVYLGIRSSI